VKLRNDTLVSKRELFKQAYWIKRTSDCGWEQVSFEYYDSMLKVLSKELTLVLSDTRELDRVPNTK